jgi:hypothetical protein
MMPIAAIAALAVLTYGMRVTGPLLRGRINVPAALERTFGEAATVLLLALAATSGLTSGHGFAGWARTTGVLVAGVLAAQRAPFPVVVLAAAAVTAALRALGAG